LVVAYFFAGGIAGAGYAIGTAADLFGGAEDRRATRLSRYLAVALTLAGALMLVRDLKRPERFLNMLRVFKLTSPMSLGSWILTLFGLVSALSLALQIAEDFLRPGKGMTRALRRAGRAVGAPGSLFGFLLAAYSGVLLSATAVPMWAKSRWTLAPTFLASAVSTGAAALSLLLALAGRPAAGTLARLRAIESVALVTELALAVVSRLHRSELERPLTKGRWGAVYQLGAIGGGMLVPLALNASTLFSGREIGRGGRLRLLGTSLLTLAGGFALRAAWTIGGIASAGEPESYFSWARRDDG
jgi:formate-dependent nitrite reductase membrane component NrfD